MVIQHILRYVLKHPDAKDTIRGIRRWWLPRGGGEWSVEAIQEALDALAARGWLTQRQTRHSGTLYGLNKDKQAEIQAFLQHEGKTDAE